MMIFYYWMTSIRRFLKPVFLPYELKSMIIHSTCYKNHTNSTCIDLYRANSQKNPENNNSKSRLITFSQTYCYRSSRPEVHCKECVLRNFARLFLKNTHREKRNTLRANHSKFATNELSKAIMLRSKKEKCF